MPGTAIIAEPLTLRAADDHKIGGFVWHHSEAAPEPRPVAIINPATSVRCRYYARFAAYLFEAGFDVLTYDYRGIGESRHGTLRGFDAGWLDWGCQDFEALLRYADHAFPGQPIHVVGHSVGGFVIGLAESSHLVRRIFTMGAQYAHWRDYAAGQKLNMLAKWHIAMPLLTMAFGYFPGKRLGWLEDTPKGVVRDWALSRARFEDTWRGRSSGRYPGKHVLVERFAAVTAPMLAVSVTDDEFGTIAAVERLLAYYRHSPRTHLRIAPARIAEPAIGHFNFFHSKFQHSLWPVALAWLRSGTLGRDPPGIVVSSDQAFAVGG